MAEVTVDASPFFLVKPHIEFGAVGDEVTFECAANAVDASPEQDETEIETFCGVWTNYKQSKWTVTVTCAQSFGTDGLENNMRPLQGEVHPFLLVPDADSAISATNVALSGSARLAPFPFMAAELGEGSEFDLVFQIQGEPTFLTAPPP